MSMRTGKVRMFASARRSAGWTMRSLVAGGAATSDGASARGGAGMKDDGLGRFSGVNQVAVIPLSP
jgi:hypothetical protein